MRFLEIKTAFLSPEVLHTCAKPYCGTMLSRKVLRILHKSIAHLIAITYLPFCWNDTKRELRVRSGFKQMAVVHATIAFEALTLVPIFIFGTKVCIDNSENFERVVMASMELICLSYVVSFQFGFYSYTHELVTFFNKYLQFEDSRCKLDSCYYEWFKVQSYKYFEVSVRQCVSMFAP